MSLVSATRSAAFLTLGFLLLPGLSSAQQTSPGYTTEQATAGKEVYDAQCVLCHGEQLEGAEFGPPLKGNPFLAKWGNKAVGELYANMATTMPTGAPRSLGDEVYADILAYILQGNGVRSGTIRLPGNPVALSNYVFPATGPNASGGLSGGVELPPSPDRKANPLGDISPITDEMLADGPTGDWLAWRRTNDAVGFSPLARITNENVGDLRVAWTWTLPAGPSQVTALVHDGVMFVQGFNDIVQALDAATGDLLWQYTHWATASLNDGLKRKRSIALYDRFVYLPTSDVHLVALDMKTGDVVWDARVGDIEAGLQMTGGPLAAEDMVMIGTSGRSPGGNYIVGLDARTGEEAWRFHTIARPLEPGGNSWNGLPLDERNGASVWTPGSYSRELGLAFFGPAQTYDTGPLLVPVKEPGVTNDALYTNSTLALDPKTGELAWHFQHLPNDQWDLDWAFERTLLELSIDGEVRNVVVTGGKQAIYDALDAETGEYLFSMNLGLENLVTSIDPETGQKHIDPALYPGPNKSITVCPHAGGAKNWIPNSYNPETHVMYMALMESCMDLSPQQPGDTGLSSGVRWTLRPPPGHDGRYGRLQAVNLETRETEWTVRQRAPRTSGVLATRGGLVFVGDLDRYFKAYDDATGEELWSVRLNDVPNTAPISFEVNGKQYIAITVGRGGPLSVDRLPLVPEIRSPSHPGATVWVFELQGNPVGAG